MRILLLDIETAPNVAHVWGLWDQNVGLNQLLASGYVMSWAAKWYGEEEVMFDSVMQSRPKAMLKSIHKLLSEADVVVHYNGTKFDIPTLNKEFVKHGMMPPSPYKQVDLLRVVKRQFRYPSNKLAYVAQELGCTPKEQHEGHTMWIKCMARDPAAWVDMEKYNRQDVGTLEEVYVKLLPWIPNHPNRGIYEEPGVPVCPTCGSTHLQRRGISRTITGKFARYQCVDCGTWTRAPTQDNDKLDRTILMRHAA